MQGEEKEAVRTTIVGGRPPGSGKNIGQVPRGIELLVKKAAVDPEFRTVLHEKRAGAAREIDLTLTSAETAMLNAVPSGQLEAIIAATRVRPTTMPALLGKSAAAMLLALAAIAVGCDSGGVVLGEQPDRPEATEPAEKEGRPDQGPVKPKDPKTITTTGIVPHPDEQPATEPEKPAEQPQPEVQPPEEPPTPTPAPHVTRGIQPDRPLMTKGIRPDRPKAEQ